MLITLITNQCTKAAHRPRQVAFGTDILLGLGLMILGGLAMKDNIDNISSLTGRKLLIFGGIYSLGNIFGIHHLLNKL